MEIKQLKASLQLAKMRLDSDPSDANQAKYEQAKQAYEICLKSEDQKIEQVSGKSENSGVPEDIATTDDVAGDAFKVGQKQSRAQLAILKTINSIVKANAASTPTGSENTEKSENPEKPAEHLADLPLISAPSTIATPTEAVPAADDTEKKTDDLAAPQE